MADTAVKVDSDLLKKIEDFVKKNKFIYSNKKQVVNLAILEFLKSKSFIKDKKRRQEWKAGI